MKKRKVSRLKKFEVIFPVKQAQGQQVFHIFATDEEQVRKKIELGELGECVQNEIEITSSHPPEIREIDAD